MPAATIAVKVTDCPEFDGFCEEAKEVVVAARFTTCFTASDVLPEKLESPEYTAWIESVPPDFRVEVAKEAEPLLSGCVASTVAPCINVTVPSGGEPPSLEATVAVKVTVCPYAEGFSEDDIVVVVPVAAALRQEAAPNSRTIRILAIFMRISKLTLLSGRAWPVRPSKSIPWGRFTTKTG